MTTIPREELMRLAQQAGFGGNLRNTHAVKLELFAKLIQARLEKQKESASC